MLTQHHLKKKKVDLASLKLDVDKLDIDDCRTVHNDLNNLESKIKKINVDKLKTIPFDLKSLRDTVF